MKSFKKIDLWISVILIIFFTTINLIRPNDSFIIGYFVVGGWQVISMLVHTLNGWFCANGSKRYNYHWIVVITIILGLLGIAIYPVFLFIFLPLLFIAPVMAVWYTWICYQEVHVKMKRPLSLLK